MLKLIAKLILKISGWTVDKQLPPEIKRCVVVAAPHTSNWDYLYMMCAFFIFKLRIKVTVKREWMRFPYSIVTKPLGGIAVDRRPKNPDDPRPSLVESLISLFEKNEELILVFTPEGSRSKRDEWKTGFYHAAKGAGVPICLGYVDYKHKIAGIKKTIYPSDFEEDMKEIMAFYQGITARFPEKFIVDKKYL
jgi:1-acyl-sn-glycerol-3-phosphate acyltransferase